MVSEEVKQAYKDGIESLKLYDKLEGLVYMFKIVWMGRTDQTLEELNEFARKNLKQAKQIYQQIYEIKIKYQDKDCSQLNGKYKELVGHYRGFTSCVNKLEQEAETQEVY